MFFSVIHRAFQRPFLERAILELTRGLSSRPFPSSPPSPVTGGGKSATKKKKGIRDVGAESPATPAAPLSAPAPMVCNLNLESDQMSF